jgi:hypothetical protein
LLRPASGPATIPNVAPDVITSAVSKLAGIHDRIQVFNRGKHAGELVLKMGDGAVVARALRGGREEA